MDGSIISAMRFASVVASMLVLGSAGVGQVRRTRPVGIPGASQQRTACTAISQADLEAIMGFPVLPPQERPAEPFAHGVSLPDEISSSSCVFEPAREETKRFNSGIRITVRYVRSPDAEGLLSNLINQIEGSHDLRQDSLGNGFGYPVM